MSTTGVSLKPARINRLRRLTHDMVRAGGKEREIASELGVSMRTVQRYKTATPATPETLRRLSPQQRLVLAHIAAGYTNPQIAARLGIVVDTVKAHVEAILKKLEATNRWQAIVIGFRAGELP
jgi:DNA-binding NarL/FixJ family response regulator